jgi:hypothetical protein
MSWNDMLKIIFDTFGLKKRIVTTPTFFATIYGKRMKKMHEQEGREGGLDLARLFQDIQSKELYFDPCETAKLLGYERTGVKDAIEETIRACYPERF